MFELRIGPIDSAMPGKRTGAGFTLEVVLADSRHFIFLAFSSRLRVNMIMIAAGGVLVLTAFVAVSCSNSSGVR
jgi:hypothetical protein